MSDVKVSIDAIMNTCRARDAALAERDRLRREVEALRDRMAEWVKNDPVLEDLLEDVDAILRGES